VTGNLKSETTILVNKFCNQAEREVKAKKRPSHVKLGQTEPM